MDNDPNKPNPENQPPVDNNQAPKADDHKDPPKVDQDLSIHDMMIENLKADLQNVPDLSFLKKEDQIKTLMQLKKLAKDSKPKEGEQQMNNEPEQKPNVQNPASPDAVASITYTPLAERNKVGGQWWIDNVEKRQGVQMYRGKK